MAVQDSRIFRLLFEPRGAIDQFKEKPDRNFVVIRGYFIAKKPILRLIRYLLPGYRIYRDDNELVEKLYLGKTHDINIRRLSNSLTPPILSDEQIREFEKTAQNQQDSPEQKEDGLNNWLDKLEGHVQEAALKRVQKELSKPPTGGGQPPQAPKQINIPRPKWKIPSGLKNLSSQGQILARRGGINAARGIGGMFKGVGGNLLGGGAKLGTGALQLGGRGLMAAGAVIGGSAGAPIIVAVLVVLGVLIVGPLLMNLLESESFLPPFKQNVSTVEAAGITDITNCQFYRGGDPTPATQIANPLLASKITEISDKVGVPPAVIAGIMRVETGQALTSTSDYISNDYDAHFSKDEEDNPVAFGIMQFTPGTFIGTFNNNKARLQTLFNKTDVSTAIDPQNAIAPANILRIYSITDSIIAAAFKVRSDKNLINGDGPWDETTIKKIAERYYGVNKDGTTNYPGFNGSTQNYGNDLWNSLQSCQITQQIVSCPVSGGIIKNPSYQEYLINPAGGGHCSPSYGTCPAESRRAKSIDVDTQGQNVVLPTIQGQPIKWAYISNFLLNNPGDCETNTNNCGIALIFQGSLGSDNWTLHLLHIDVNSLQIPLKGGANSGEIVGKTVSGSYLHINIGKNIINPANPPLGSSDFDTGWIVPDLEAQICIK